MPAEKLQEFEENRQDDDEEILVQWQLAPAPPSYQRGATPVLVDPSDFEDQDKALSPPNVPGLDLGRPGSEASADIESIISANRSITDGAWHATADAASITTSKIMPRGKHFISPNLLERIRRWQVERDRAEGVVRHFTNSAKPPRFPVRSSTMCSRLSETNFTLTPNTPLDIQTVDPIEVCQTTTCSTKSVLNLAQQVHCQTCSVNTEDLSEEEENQEDAKVAIIEQVFKPVFFEAQINPVLCGAPIEEASPIATTITITAPSKRIEMLPSNPCIEDGHSTLNIEGMDFRGGQASLVHKGAEVFRSCLSIS